MTILTELRLVTKITFCFIPVKAKGLGSGWSEGYFSSTFQDGERVPVCRQKKPDWFSRFFPPVVTPMTFL